MFDKAFRMPHFFSGKNGSEIGRPETGDNNHNQVNGHPNEESRLKSRLLFFASLSEPT